MTHNENVIPRIEIFSATKFVGKKSRMSFANNQTEALWKSFMPARSEIKNTLGTDLYSMEVYPAGFFEKFNPALEFDKWAAVAVEDIEALPEGMESIATEGLYAVFLYVGASSAAKDFYEYIYQSWLPASNFSLDDRPHFAIMGEKYNHQDTSSEEEIFIPIRFK